MATHKIHLAQGLSARGWSKSVGTSAKDAQIINGVFEIAVNSAVGTKAVYLSKRPGSTTGGNLGSSPRVLKHYSSFFSDLSTTGSGFFFQGSTNLGTISSAIDSKTNYLLADAVIGGKGVVGFVTSDHTGYFLYHDADNLNFPTFTGNRTSGSPIITGIASTTGIYKGEAISGTGIPVSARVLSVDSPSQITMTANATSGAATATTITKEAISKIIDADFPADANSMVAMDGYFFVGTDSGSIYQSSINDPSSWAATDFVSADYCGDEINFIFKIGNYICAAGSTTTVQYFNNTGNPTGSVLSSAENLTVVGLQVRSAPVPFGDGYYCVAGAGVSGVQALNLYRVTGVNSFAPVGDDFCAGVIRDGSLSQIGALYSGNTEFVLVHSASANPCIAYQPGNNTISLFSFSSALTSASNSIFTKTGETTLFAISSGNTWTDSDVAYTLTIQTEPQIMANGLDTADVWVDLIADVESTGTATLSVSDDDYASWTTVGTFDMTKVKKRVQPGTLHSARAYRIQHSANTNFRGQMLIINHSPASA